MRPAVIFSIWVLWLMGAAGPSALTGQDRADMLAYGRSVWAEARLRRNLEVSR